jgi:hypothetical protein
MPAEMIHVAGSHPPRALCRPALWALNEQLFGRHGMNADPEAVKHDLHTMSTSKGQA